MVGTRVPGHVRSADGPTMIYRYDVVDNLTFKRRLAVS